MRSIPRFASGLSTKQCIWKQSSCGLWSYLGLEETWSLQTGNHKVWIVWWFPIISPFMSCFSLVIFPSLSQGQPAVHLRCAEDAGAYTSASKGSPSSPGTPGRIWRSTFEVKSKLIKGMRCHFIIFYLISCPRFSNDGHAAYMSKEALLWFSCGTLWQVVTRSPSMQEMTRCPNRSPRGAQMAWGPGLAGGKVHCGRDDTGWLMYMIHGQHRTAPPNASIYTNRCIYIYIHRKNMMHQLIP